MRPIKIRDIRIKEKYSVDDAYLNGWAKIVGFAGTAVYNSLCRHADINQSSFPSVKKIAEEHGAAEKTIKRAIKKLKELNIIQVEKIRSNKGKWLNNTYILVDKSNWLKIPRGQIDTMVNQGSNMTITTGQKDTTTTGQIDPTKDTHIEGNTYKDSNYLKNLTLLRQETYRKVGKPMLGESAVIG